MGCPPEGPDGKDCWKDLERRAKESWDRSHGTPWKDQLGRTAGRTWEGGPGYPPEGPDGKDFWKDPGRRAHTSLDRLHGPGNHGIGHMGPPSKDQLGRTAGMTWE